MNAVVRVLVIEDDAGIALALYKGLTRVGYQVATAKTGGSGLRKVGVGNFDVIVLDIGLPDISGRTVCSELRKRGVTVPVIVLTAEASIRSKVTLLDAGANDYVTKPFSLEELQARIRSCTRPAPIDHSQKPLQVGALLLHRASRTVERNGNVIQLRRKEFAILEFMMLHAGSVVTRAGLMQYAWEEGEERWTNTVDVHIKHLRDKIDRGFETRLITTVHGLGYRFETPKAVMRAP